ncbi:glycosyltransferase family 2 protein [Nitrospirillum pindoramense]|uniref:Glycosyl transferase family 2 n=1 Tax=Nitrospirillum amazonense TaxID=28077 RepID=A0A560GW21_9PROT|nr:glycosyltransferase family 2 protein [Nitrospirillum amazonense]TWB37640.1 glycosyl transferase family 2 [Nitrospirillum amazonense]
MKLHAILITRNDDLIIGDWLRRHHGFFDTIAVVDGSDGTYTRTLCADYANVRYDRDPPGPITDQTLRHRGYEMLRDAVTEGDWFFAAHPDEFLIHDPRSLMSITANIVMWLPLHILPHTTEIEAWRVAEGRHPTTLFSHFWWRRGAVPHCEYRMWKLVREPVWDLVSTKPSTSVIPMNYMGEAIPTLVPIYLHYKCYNPCPDLYEADGRLKKSNLNTGMPSAGQGEYFFDDDHPYMEQGVAWNVARFTTPADLVARFGNPPRLVQVGNELTMVNDEGAVVH